MPKRGLARLELTEGPAESGSGGDDVTRPPAPNKSVLPHSEPATSRQDREPVAEAGTVNAGEDKILELREGEQPHLREPHQDRPISREFGSVSEGSRVDIPSHMDRDRDRTSRRARAVRTDGFPLWVRGGVLQTINCVWRRILVTFRGGSSEGLYHVVRVRNPPIVRAQRPPRTRPWIAGTLRPASSACCPS